ncbi:MAG: hypothetical protein NWR47_04405 [Aestuariivirgaceae bacterium]|nr:hypothetical protein [Aestuariivirgaceae bacterium]
MSKEPGLVEILDDPIVQSLMKSDGVDRVWLELLLSDVHEKRSEAEVHLGAHFW